MRRRKPFLRALADASATARQLLNIGVVPLVPHADIAARLPPGLLLWLSAVPTGEDPRTGVVDLAVVDEQDAFPAQEVSHHLRAPVRLVRASLDAIEKALDALGAASQPLTDRTFRLASSRPGPAASLPPRTVPNESHPPPSNPLNPLNPLEESAMPLVRRARASLAPFSAEPTLLLRPTPPDTPELTQPPETPRVVRPTAIAMVLDFGPSLRDERREGSAIPARPPSTLPGAPAPRAPPYPPLAPHLTAIERVMQRSPLVDALAQGLATAANVVVVLGVRRGEMLAVGAAGQLSPSRVDGRKLPLIGALAACIEQESGRRVGLLDFALDAELIDILELRGAPNAAVLLQTVLVAGKPAMVLAASGSADLEECGRRAFALAEAGSRALVRLLRRT